MTHNPSYREFYFPFQANRFSVLSIKNLNHSSSPVFCIEHGSFPKVNVKKQKGGPVLHYISIFSASVMFGLQFYVVFFLLTLNPEVSALGFRDKLSYFLLSHFH